MTPRYPEIAAGAANKPKVVEPCTNAAQAIMPGYEASTMARPEPDPPEVAREDTKCVCDPNSDNPYSSSRQKFVEPTDKLPMTAMAWDKIHIFADMASKKMIQCVQPLRMRKPDENEKRVYDKFYGSSANNMTQIHNIAKDGVAYEFLLFDPDSQSPGQFNKHRPAAEMFRLYISRIFITDDLADMMLSYCNFVENVTESDDPPLNVSRSKRYQGRQLEALTEGLHDDHHQRRTLPNHEITCPMSATYKSIAMGEQNHRVKTCLIMFDEAHKLYSETDNDNVPSKSATERSVMMHNTATIKPTYSLASAVYADDENEVPPEEHDDYNINQAKKIAPLDALFPKI
jgi:hypothetical protein